VPKYQAPDQGSLRWRHLSSRKKDPLIKRKALELVRAYYKIREACVRKRIFEMVKAVGAASHAEVLSGRKKR
jgi:hypothetical protein